MLSIKLPGISTISKTTYVQIYANQNLSCLNLNAFPITDTELTLIAAPAIIGFNRSPQTGYKIPAAIGIPKALYINAKNKF